MDCGGGQACGRQIARSLTRWLPESLSRRHADTPTRRAPVCADHRQGDPPVIAPTGTPYRGAAGVPSAKDVCGAEQRSLGLGALQRASFI
ncbi:hypothetical protein GCM10023089_29470 [Quisquiliibacterium transsilvanicum]